MPAIDAPGFHSRHFPDSFYPHASFPRRIHMEARWPDEVVEELRERGHDVVVDADWSIGRMTAAARESDGTLKAAANPRGMQGYAAGR